MVVVYFTFSHLVTMTRLTVFLCEKPSQGKDIAPHVGARDTSSRGCITGPNVVVTWCMGHLLEQAKPEHYDPALRSWDLRLLPVCPDKWHMEVKSSTADQYRVVQACMQRATDVVIATDADREGEVIARSVLDRVGYGGPVRRLWLGALDPASVKKALAALLPNTKTLPMYFSGIGRARADWLTGMNMTMALTTAFGAGGRGGVLHCGRVQTPVLALVVRRERAIANFKPKKHYVLAASFEMQGTTVPMDWRVPPAHLDPDGHCIDKAYVEAVAQKITLKAGRITKVITTPEREMAPLPYSLGSLQQEASARFGLKVQVVLDACQALYEKHKATTYPRTDCEHLPVSMFAEVPDVLSALTKVDPGSAKLISLADVTRQGRAFNDKKVTAHHAIVPTGNPAVRMNEMSPVERQIYDLVRRRYMAQFLGDFLFNKTVIEVVCEGELFGKTGKMPTSPGWKRVNDGLVESKPSKAAEETDAAAVDVALPPVKVGDQCINRLAQCVATKTKPPKRFTEGTLLAALESVDKIIDDPRLKKIMQTKEKAGIGTDGTRAGILEGLFKRDYMANSKRQIIPTDKGNSLITLIEEMAPELADPVLTATWEDQLQQIESGTADLVQFERDLGIWLRQVIDNIRAQALQRPRTGVAGTTSASPAPTGTVHACALCGRPMRQRKGSAGLFWGCTGYPDCRHTLPDLDGKPSARADTVTARRPEPKPVEPTRATPATSPPFVGRPSGGPAAGSVGGSAGPDEATGTPEQKLCGLCGKPMRLRQGANGPFYGCSGFPVCRSTQKI